MISILKIPRRNNIFFLVFLIIDTKLCYFLLEYLLNILILKDKISLIIEIMISNKYITNYFVAKIHTSIKYNDIVEKILV